MTNVLIIGATGTIGQAVTQALLATDDAQLTLFARHTPHLSGSPRERIIAGDVMNRTDLDHAMQGQDVVFAALSGSLDKYAKQIIASMQQQHVSRLLFIASMGIYDEIPATIGASGNLSHNPVLQTYRQAADEIEQSNLNYTIIRPGWFTSGPIDYEVTDKGEPFGGHDVSINSIADLVKRLVADENLYARGSVGINTPEH